MREKELREAAQCVNCGEKIGHAAIPIFHRVKVQTYGLDGAAVRRQAGLEMMLGGAVEIAQVMGPDDDLAKSIGQAVEFTICFDCWLKRLPIAELTERKISIDTAAESG